MMNILSFMAPEILILGLFLLLLIPIIILPILDVIRNIEMEPGLKILWILVILGAAPLGTLLYYCIRNRYYLKKKEFNPDFSKSEDTNA